MPVLYPTGIGMAFELAAYGAVIGLLYAKLNKRGVAGVYMALVPAMLAGRAVWGVAQTVLLGLGGNGFTMQMFIAGAFATALPGIVLQLVLIPVVMWGWNTPVCCAIRCKQKNNTKYIISAAGKIFARPRLFFAAKYLL